MPWRRFLAVDIAGSGLWVGTWCIGLYAMERHAALLHAWLERLNPWVAGAFLAALAGLLVWLLRRRGRS